MSLYRKTILFLGSMKIFLVVLVVTIVTVTLGVMYPDIEPLGYAAVTALLYFFFHIVVISSLSISLDNTMRAEKAAIKEQHKQKVIAEHEEFIEDYRKRIGTIFDEAVDALPQEVPKDDAVIILVEIHNRSPLEGGSNEK